MLTCISQFSAFAIRLVCVLLLLISSIGSAQAVGRRFDGQWNIVLKLGASCKAQNIIRATLTFKSGSVTWPLYGTVGRVSKTGSLYMSAVSVSSMTGRVYGRRGSGSFTISGSNSCKGTFTLRKK